MLNLLLFTVLFQSRDYFFTRYTQFIFQKNSQVQSVHITLTTSLNDAKLDLFHISEASALKKLTLSWTNQDNPNAITMIFNQDDTYVQFNSKQLEEYFNSTFGIIAQAESNNALDPLISGQTWLHLNNQNLDAIEPNPDFEEEVLESNRIMKNELINSLSLRSVPTIALIDNSLLLKLPLKITFSKLNQIIYPALKSYLVTDQALLEEILNQTTLDLYLNHKLQIVKVVAQIPSFTSEQIDKMLGDSPVNSFGQLNDNLKTYLNEYDSGITITIDFTEYNEKFDIGTPTDTILFQDLLNKFAPPQAVTPSVVANTTKYRVNNGYQRTSSGAEVDSNMAQIHNMLYRYYNERSLYPASLDSLAYQYFPGNVPGNPSTAQSYYYQSFDNNQGYLLCPTSTSSRNYCYKKFKLNEVN